MSRRHWLIPFIVYIGGSTALHLLWENLQAPLYEGFVSFQQHFWICFKATSGDLLFMLIIYAALAIAHRNPFWVAERSAYAHPATWIITLLLGALLAVSFELWAVYVDHRWQYADAMPLLPILRIGLTPVLQMVFVPLIALLFTRFFSSRP
mgnify:FL=1